MRVEQFPGQTLKASTNKQLFCEACRSVVPNISSSISSHVATEKHKQNLVKFTKLQASDCALHRDLADYFAENTDESMVSVLSHDHERPLVRKPTPLLPSTFLDRPPSVTRFMCSATALLKRSSSLARLSSV